MTNEIEIISVDQIIIPEDRQRKAFPEAQHQELCDSITTVGLINPLLVRRTSRGYDYELVAGERRFRAISSLEQSYKMAGVDEAIEPGFVPCIVRNFGSQVTVREVELHENLIRLDLSWQDKVNAISALHALKLQENPNHRVGDTAVLIGDVQPSGYAKTQDHNKVAEALFIAEHLDNPEVVAAKSIKDAKKIVSRHIEKDALEQLAALRDKKERAKQEAIADTEVEETFELPEGIIPEAIVSKEIGTLLVGDVRERIKDLKANTFSVVICDGPYGMGADKFNDGGRSTQQHNYDDGEIWRELHQTVITELDRICKPDAHVYMFCDIDNYHEIREMFSEGWWVRRKPLVWNKGSSGKLADGTKTGWRTVSEYIIFARRGDRPSSELLSDVLSVSDLKNKTHAAQKPPELYEILLRQASVPGDSVLDPFAGSGTIFTVARKFMVNPVGIEQNPVNAELCRAAQQTGSNPANDIEDLLP